MRILKGISEFVRGVMESRGDFDNDARLLRGATGSEKCNGYI